MRDFEKAAKAGRAIAHKRSGLDIGSYTIHQMKERFDEAPTYNMLFELVTKSYYAGLAVGYRNAKGK